MIEKQIVQVVTEKGIQEREIFIKISEQQQIINLLKEIKELLKKDELSK